MRLPKRSCPKVLQIKLLDRFLTFHGRVAAMADAGLTGRGFGASAHPLLVVLEPEAAAVFCASALKDELFGKVKPGDATLIVDCGGGTVDGASYRRLSAAAC